MTIDLYYLPASAPCRSVMMTAKELGLELNLKPTNLMAGEHLTPEYLKINPTHTIPTMVDTDNGDFSLWESRAIMAYLVNKYSPGHTLYPSDPQKRAVVDRYLYFDAGTLYPAQAKVMYPQLFRGETPPEADVQAFKDKLTLLDTLLAGNKYANGENLTLADLALLASLSTLQSIDFDISAFPNVNKWYTGLESELPYHKEMNIENGVELLKQMAEKMKKKE